MKKLSINNFLLKSRLQAIGLSIFAVIGLINAAQLWRKDREIQKIKRFQPHQPVGQKFYGLDKLFQGKEFVGYYTDKDLSEAEHNRQYSEAQYIIAPVILDINNTDHDFTLFDCQSEEYAQAKIQEINAVVIQKHGGLILTRKQP